MGSGIAHAAVIAYLVARAPAATKAPVGAGAGVEFSVAERVEEAPAGAPAGAPAKVVVAPVRRRGEKSNRGPGTGDRQPATTDAEGVSGVSGVSPGADSPGPDSPGPVVVAPPATPDAEAVRSALQGAVRYPRLARSQGLEGEVVIRFRVDEAGQPRELSVIRSAGPLFDEAAQAAVARAAPFHSPPGWVRVPVQFSLREPP